MSEQQGKRTFGGRYEAVKRIGVGGMAEVYKAVDTVLNRVVAVKVLLPKYAGDPTFITGFLDEARAAARLSSPYTVSIFDWGQDADCCYIVIEYIRGIDLRCALSRRGIVHPRKVAEIASQVCSALVEAHDKEIVHRDIKSANIMMQASGDIKLMDFGIAGRSTIEHDREALPTMGTVQYMSPEQIRGEDAAPASDLYSLGIVMYELGTGMLPFTGGTPRQIAKMQLENDPIPPRHLSMQVDPRLNEIVLRALEKDPTRRFRSAQEMKDALDGYLASDETGTDGTEFPQYWALAFTRGPEQLRGSIRMLESRTTIGRSPECGIVIDDSSISRKHLALTPRGLYLEIRDLHSSNGTRRNGIPVEGSVLCRAGDTVDVGNVRFKIGRK